MRRSCTLRIVSLAGHSTACCCLVRLVAFVSSRRLRNMGCCCSSEKSKKSGHGRRNRGDRSHRHSIREERSRRGGSPEERSVIMRRTMKRGEPVKYIAQWDYKAGSNSELNLTKGDMLTEEPDEGDAGPEWVFVSNPGKGTGYAPRAWLAKVGSMDTEPWFFGELKRATADKILGGEQDGIFLVRSHTSREGINFVLSIADSNAAKHYRIKNLQGRDGKKQYFVAKKKFDSIPELLDFFKRTSDGICCQLIAPPPKREPERVELSADVQKNWQEIPRKQIQIVGELGKGNFGFVRKGIWRPTGAISLNVAVKELKPGSTNARKEFLREAVAMKNLVHERLVKLHGIVSADEPYWIVTEFVKDGSLRDYLRKRDKAQNWLVEPKLVEIATQIADGMRYLESKNVVHRDLAARNVLVEELPGETIKQTVIKIKIADFGMATLVKGRRVREKKAMELAVKWTAPEALKDLRFSTASDVWSFGILLHEVFTHGKDPYPGMTARQLKDEMLKEKKFLLNRAENVPEKIYELMVGCCMFNYQNRLSFQDVYESLEKYYDKGVDPYERYRQ